MNCRDYIIEFEERGTLSETATLHLTICADCRRTSRNQTQVWLMIDKMPPIAAPSDFDFHVKARIAKAKPSDFRSPGFFPALRYVLPLSVVVLFFGLLAFNSTYFNSSSIESPTARNNQDNQPAVTTLPSDNFLPTEQTVAEVAPPEITAAPPTFYNSPNNRAGARFFTAELSPKTNGNRIKNSVSNRKRPARRFEAEINPDDGLGSKDSAQTKQEPLLPAGFSNTAKNTNFGDIAPTKQISDADLLSFFGIQTVSKDGVRTITALTKDSPAERSGAKVGDVIESLNNSLLLVRRGTEKIEISLLN